MTATSELVSDEDGMLEEEEEGIDVSEEGNGIEEGTSDDDPEDADDEDVDEDGAGDSPHAERLSKAAAKNSNDFLFCIIMLLISHFSFCRTIAFYITGGIIVNANAWKNVKAIFLPSSFGMFYNKDIEVMLCLIFKK